MARVLIVENEPDIRAAFQTFFELRGYVVRLAGDGPAALQEIATEPPDVVLLDLYLPRMHGLEVLRLLQTWTPGVNVIVVSAHVDDITRESARALGARACLQKPVCLHDLQTFVTYTLAKSGTPPRWH